MDNNEGFCPALLTDGPPGLTTTKARSRNLSAGTLRSRCRGFLIVVVVIVILLVSLAAYSFLAMMVSEHRAARARGDQLQAESVAFSGREYLAAVLESPRSQRPEGAETDDLAETFGNVLVDGDSDRLNSMPDDGERQGRFYLLVGERSEVASASRPFRCGYENESAKLNLSALVDWDKQQANAGREALMNLPGMDQSTADAILDWVDADDVPRDLGAEAEYYSGLDPPYRPRNGAPQNLEELLLVRGVTREQLLGADLNANFRIDSWEENLVADQATQAFGAQLPWSHFLTVHSGERNESYDGNKKIQLNQKELGVLHQKLTAATEPAWANFIIAYRQFGKYDGSEEGEDASSYTVDLSRPAVQQVKSILDLIDIRVAIRKEENDEGEKKIEKVLVSPFSAEPSQMRDYLPKLFDLLMVSDGRPIFGRVNINLAPREVLAAIPGIETAQIERILAARGLAGQGDSSRHEAVWLLADGIVDQPAMRQLLPRITAGGDVGRAQVIGYYDLRSPIMRFETVIDATSVPARQVYYKDLRRLGRGALLDAIGSRTGY